VLNLSLDLIFERIEPRPFARIRINRSQ
jgi:hypothetical protein